MLQRIQPGNIRPTAPPTLTKTNVTSVRLYFAPINHNPKPTSVPTIARTIASVPNSFGK